MTVMTQADSSELFRCEPHDFIDVGEGQVAYRRVGSGPDVLFVHGWPVSGATFRKLLPHLTQQVTCHIIDLPSAGSSRFDRSTTITIRQHINSVRRVIDWLDTDSVAVVGHDSGGLIARHAAVGDQKLRAMGLIDTEPLELGWRFRSFIEARRLPGFGKALGWVAAKPALRRTKFVLGDAFNDASLLDGEFAEFFLEPLNQDPERLAATLRALDSFDLRLVRELEDVHKRLDVPVRLVWGEDDKFFPVANAQAMVSTFPSATLEVIPDAGLFSHEERPAEVAAALLPVLQDRPPSA